MRIGRCSVIHFWPKRRPKESIHRRYHKNLSSPELNLDMRLGYKILLDNQREVSMTVLCGDLTRIFTGFQ